jgi:hypothetical protein
VLLQTMQRLAYEGEIAQDYIAPIGVELRQKEHLPVIRFSNDGELMMNMRHQPFTLHDMSWKIKDKNTVKLNLL